MIKGFKKFTCMLILSCLVSQAFTTVYAESSDINFEINQVVDMFEDTESELRDKITNNTIESVKIIEAIKLINKNRIKDSEVYKDFLEISLETVGEQTKDYKEINDTLDTIAKRYKTYLSNKTYVTAYDILSAVKGISYGDKTNDFIAPVDGAYLTSLFGDAREEEFGHTGIDLACDKNTEIKAAEDGIVLFAGDCGTYGTMVMILHESEYVTIYGHMIENSYKVTFGDIVEKGDTIGLVGLTGRTTGYHVHFEIIKDGERVNPIDYLDYEFIKWN